MDNLTAQQLILLALFVSFVTSIATGIFTVSLLEQAPSTVTQTINRIVERTVETVVEGKTEVINTLTEVPAEERVTTAITKVVPALVRVAARPAAVALASTTAPSPFAALFRAVAEGVYEGVGFIVNAKEGLVVTDGVAAFEKPEQLSIILLDGTAYDVAEVVRHDGFALVRVISAGGLPVAATLKNELLTLGQTVIALGYDGTITTTAIGFVSGYRAQNASSTAIIRTSIEPRTDIVGGPLLITTGDVVGLNAAEGGVVPAHRIAEVMQEYLADIRQNE